MKINVNGAEVTLDNHSTTILALLQNKGVNPDQVVVEYNDEIPDRETWGTIRLAEGDRLEIVKFMGGG